MYCCRAGSWGLRYKGLEFRDGQGVMVEVDWDADGFGGSEMEANEMVRTGVP